MSVIELDRTYPTRGTPVTPPPPADTVYELGIIWGKKAVRADRIYDALGIA